MGPTNSYAAKSNFPWTIRGKFGIDGTRNAVHGSDSLTSASREISIMFSKSILNSYLTPIIQPTKDLVQIPYTKDKNLHTALLEGVSKLCEIQPEDKFTACEWLGKWLVQYSSNLTKSTIISQSEPTKHVKVVSKTPVKKLCMLPLYSLHLVAIFGSTRSYTATVAKQLAKTFNYQYIDMDSILKQAQTHIL